MAAFSKPIVAAVNGTTMGLGVSILPLCDLVLASDKATFYIPYSDIGQSLEGGASLTFPKLSGSLVSTFWFDSRIGSDGLFFIGWGLGVQRSQDHCHGGREDRPRVQSHLARQIQ